MNPSLIARLAVDLTTPSSRRKFVEKNGNMHNAGKKYRRGKRYAREAEEKRLDILKREQRKREKVSYDSWRIEEVPNEKDEILANFHYANFLGDKHGDNGARYNNKLSINLKFCDSMRDEESVAEDSLLKNADSYCEVAIDFDDNFSELSLGSIDEEVFLGEEIFIDEEERRKAEEDFKEMCDYASQKRKEQHYKNRHIAAVMANGYSPQEAERLVECHESLNLGGWCDEACYV